MTDYQIQQMIEELLKTADYTWWTNNYQISDECDYHPDYVDYLYALRRNLIQVARRHLDASTQSN